MLKKIIKVVSPIHFKQAHRKEKLVASIQGQHINLFRQPNIKYVFKQPISVISFILRSFQRRNFVIKLFAIEFYYQNRIDIINSLQLPSVLASAISLLPPDFFMLFFFGKLFNIGPIVIGLFSLNVFTVRHFVIHFLSQNIFRLLFVSSNSVA